MSMLKLHNTLTRKKEDFVPIDNDHVRVYACGPTVYGRIHVGNARPIVVFDVLVRLLRLRHAKVTYVRNITDVDDKINIRAAERGISINDLCAETIKTFHNDTARLGSFDPDIEPRATHHIDEMQAMITTLIEKGHAYEADGHVLFQVSTMDAYGALSKRSMDDMIAGARVEVAPYKREAADFILWKPSNGDQPGWNSPWGWGRPGWHIECSAMVRQELGLTIDIHLGGGDLVFPHHENEIAQSETANEATLARFWMHNGMVNVGGTKMSKSLGNFTTIRGLLDSGVSPMTLRLFVLQAHYRKPLDFTAEALDAAATGWKGLNAALQLGERHGVTLGWADSLISDRSTWLEEQRLRFVSAMDDDLNSSGGLAVLFELARPLRALANRLDRGDAPSSAEGELHSQWQLLHELAEVLGLKPEATEAASEGALDEAAIADLIDARRSAKQAKDYSEADRIRDELKQAGIELIDKAGGVTDWIRA